MPFLVRVAGASLLLAGLLQAAAVPVPVST